MEVQEGEGTNSRESKNEEQERMELEQFKFVLSAEKYLSGCDIRGIVYLEQNKYGVIVWNDSKIYQIDRDKPEVVIQFNMPFGEKNCISMRLIPYYEPS